MMYNILLAAVLDWLDLDAAIDFFTEADEILNIVQIIRRDRPYTTIGMHGDRPVKCYYCHFLLGFLNQETL